MIRALLRKELRELRPWGILSLAAGLLAIVPHLLTIVDMQPLARTFSALADENVVLFWLMGFAIGTGLTTREHVDGTLSFLDGLPVTRTQVFLTKSVVILALVLLAPTVRFVSVIVMHLLSRGSLDHELHWPLLLQAFGVQTLLIANAVFVGAAIGRLQHLTWLAVAAVATGLMLLMQRYPRTTALNPLSVRDVELTPAGLVLDRETMWVQLALTASAFVIAWFAFTRIGRARRRSVPVRRPIVGAVVTITTIAMLAVALLLWTRSRDGESFDESAYAEQEPYFAPSPPAQTQTRHYRISYPADESEAALRLAAQADAIFERVHQLLHTPPGAPIDVDASGSTVNTDGTAYLGRIRLRLDSDMRIVLSHETTHVVSQRLAGGDRDWLWENASVLSEGLATWVHYHFAEQSREREQGLLVLAALHSRRELHVEELADPERLVELRDENLKYPAGEAMIDAIVRVYGADVLPKLLRAFANPSLPADLSGIELWRATFQLAGMNLGAVEDEFYREVSKYAAEHAARIAALPRPRVRLVREGRRIGVQALIDGELHDAGPVVQLRFKPEADSSLDDLETENTLFEQPVWRAPEQISGGRVCVQAGVTGFAKQVLYEPWTCLPVSGAGPWRTSSKSEER
ncbi:MAG: hypothetical protein ABW110_24510 [Steroidobacteraceae bacterium]